MSTHSRLLRDQADRLLMRAATLGSRVLPLSGLRSGMRR